MKPTISISTNNDIIIDHNRTNLRVKSDIKVDGCQGHQTVLSVNGASCNRVTLPHAYYCLGAPTKGRPTLADFFQDVCRFILSDDYLATGPEAHLLDWIRPAAAKYLE